MKPRCSLSLQNKIRKRLRLIQHRGFTVNLYLLYRNAVKTPLGQETSGFHS